MGENLTLANRAAQAAATTGSLLATIAGATSSLALAGPIGAAIAGITAVSVFIIQQFQGCGETCTLASNYADVAERKLVLNRDAFLGLPEGQRYENLRAAALNNAQAYLELLGRACSNPALQDAGRRCISERLIEGGTAPWCPKPGGVGCDWITLYYRPILDSAFVANPTLKSTAGGGDGGGGDGGGGGNGGSTGGGGVVGMDTAGSGYLLPVMVLAAGGLLALVFKK